MIRHRVIFKNLSHSRISFDSMTMTVDCMWIALNYIYSILSVIDRTAYSTHSLPFSISRRYSSLPQP